jgi:5-methylthioadenosine/S-adenosylhomocysteine deaminase
VTTAGFIDAHSHLRSTSYAEHGVSGDCLEEGLLRMNAMTSVDTADDVFVACSDLVAHGVTGVQVMFHTFGDDSDYLETLDATITGIRRSGIRALVVLGTTDQAEFTPLGVTPEGLIPDFCLPRRRLSQNEYADVVTHALHSYPDITFGVGPVGPQWCSDGLLHLIGDISQQGLRIHSHFAESPAQRDWAGDIFQRMKQAKLFGPTTSLAHAVWLEREELDELADLGTSLVTCPLSNRLLGAGTAPLTDWREAGVQFGVGLDSAEPADSPMSVATRALSHDDALDALTTGGHSATGIDTTPDVVVWDDDTLSRPVTVQINGSLLVEDGTLLDRDEVEEARGRISRTMTADRGNREKRLADIEAILPHYLEAISGGSRDR